MKRLQDKMYAVLLDYFVSKIETKDDKIIFNSSNIEAVNRLDRILSKVLEKELQGYKRHILNGVKNILSSVWTEYSQLDVRALQVGETVGGKIEKHAATTINQIADLKPIYEDIKKQAINQMSNYDGISLRELRDSIKLKVSDKNIVQKYWSRWTYDIYSQYERIGANEVRKELGLVFAVYEGGEIETTRQFCDERNGQVFHISEIEGWKDLDWQGKQETGYNPIVDLGGYNCRHRLRWVSKEFAAARRPEVRQLFPNVFAA